MKSKQTVVIGFIGTKLDAGKSNRRWQRWRPSVSLGLHEDLPIDRFILLHQKQYEDLAILVKQDFESISPNTVVEPTIIDISNPWDLENVYTALHEFSTNFTFDPEDTDYLVHITTGTHIAQICLFLLAESRHIPAKLLQTRPIIGDEKNRGDYAIIDLDLARYDAIASRLAVLQQDDISFLKTGIKTKNQTFNALIGKIEHVAKNSHEPLLLMGPTGAGKSQLAKRIYELKKHRHQIQGAFVELNCATLRGDAAMSALFGHTKGAFTGATADRPGLLKRAHHGMVFLDEIGELGLDEQAMLLRAIEEKVFLPVGSDKTVESEFLLIAATNKDLREAVAKGTFREDLLARINLWTFALPGLKDRPEDIEPNLDHELELFATKNKKKVSFSSEARKHFLAFAQSDLAIWQSNFRDLSAAITRMSTLAPGARIRVEEVEEEIQRLKKDWALWTEQTNSFPNSAVPTKPETKPSYITQILGKKMLSQIDLFDQAQLELTLEICSSSDSLSDAGRLLFAASRAKKKHANDADRLRKYLARFGISWSQIQNNN